MSKAIHLILDSWWRGPNLLPLYMKRWKNKLAVLVTLGLVAFSSSEKALAAGNKYTIALIPGLTTDAFYITMHKGF